MSDMPEVKTSLMTRSTFEVMKQLPGPSREHGAVLESCKDLMNLLDLAR